MSSLSVQRLARYFVFRHLTIGDMRAYQRDGYLMFGQTLTELGQKMIMDGCNSAWRSERARLCPMDEQLPQEVAVPGLHRRSAVIRDFYFQGPTVDVAEDMIGSNLKCVGSSLDMTMRGGSQMRQWRQENHRLQLEPETGITVITAVDEMDRSSGCLWVIPGSHQQGLLPAHEVTTPVGRTTVTNLVVDQSRVDEKSATQVTLHAGETLVVHTNLLWRAEGNYLTKRDRRMLLLDYADADAVDISSGQPRLGRLVRGKTRFPEVEDFEASLT